MAKKLAALAGTVTASILSIDFLSGVTTQTDDGTVSCLAKKPRTSKYIQYRFAPGQFISATLGDEGVVAFMGQTEIVSVAVADINSIEVVDGVMTITDEDGEVTVLDTKLPGLTVSVESDPQDAEGAAPKAPAKGKGKAKEEEEEAPAKGKGKGKAKEEAEPEEAPAKGKGKTKPAKEEAPAKGGKDKGGKKGKPADDGWE